MPTAKFKPKSIREAVVMRWDCGFSRGENSLSGTVHAGEIMTGV